MLSHKTLTAVAALTLGLTPVATGAAAPATGAATQAETEKYIVMLDLPEQAAGPNAMASQTARDAVARATERRADAAAASGLSVGKRFHGLGGYTAQLTADQAAELRSQAGVASVERDGVATASATQSNPTWGLDRVDQDDLPLNNAFTYTDTGAGVTAYVIDTGIRATHQDLSGRVKSGYGVLGGGGTDDCNGHGTHVAGTIGGETYGVAKDVNLVPVRVLGCNGRGSWSGIIEGMDWVASNHSGPSVANMSLGGGYSASVNQAAERLVASGVVTAIAAGNETQDACNVSPASARSALTVGATTSTDAMASYSNYGSCVDVLAPGSSITSAGHRSDTATATMSGTSMASPHVAGAAALYLEDAPGASPATVGSAITGTATPGTITGVKTSPNLFLDTTALAYDGA